MTADPITPDQYHRIYTIHCEEFPPMLRESFFVFTSRIAHSSKMSLSIEKEDRLLGYVIAFPYSATELVLLDEPLMDVVREKNLFIRECAVTHFKRSQGIGTTLAKEVIQKARKKGFSSCTTLALEGSFHFWERLGFEKSDLPVPQEFGEDARFLIKHL